MLSVYSESGLYSVGYWYSGNGIIYFNEGIGSKSICDVNWLITTSNMLTSLRQVLKVYNFCMAIFNERFNFDLTVF